MIHITVSNSICQLQHHDSKVDGVLKRELSYKDNNVEFSLQKSEREIQKLNQLLDSGSRMIDVGAIERQLSRTLHIHRGLQKKLMISLYDKGSFPTGLLPRVLTILADLKKEVKLNDQRKKPVKAFNFVFKDNLPPLRYYQKTAARKLEEEGRGIVVMPTGTGKTVTIAKMIQDLGVKTLIVTPSKRINEMMFKTMEKHFGKGKVAKLNTKSGRCDKPINIVNIQALIKIEPSVLADVLAVFIDEFHHSAAETYREVNLKHLKNCYYRIGMTATNFRNDGSDIALESVLSLVLYEYSIHQAIEDGNILRPTFEILSFQQRSYSNWQEAYKQGIVLNPDRNALIADMARELSDRHLLILVKEVAHGEALKALIPGAEFINGEEADIDQDRMMAAFHSGKLKVLIGTSVIGEGVDLPVADALIMAGGGKARSQIMQNVGRVVRLHPSKKDVLIFDFTDEGCDWLEEHSRLREEVYGIYG